MRITRRRQLRKEPQLSMAKLNVLFLGWLQGALRDEAGRQILRDQLRRHELPVIELDPAAAPRSNPDAER